MGPAASEELKARIFHHRSCKKLNITQSPGVKKHPTYNKKDK